MKEHIYSTRTIYEFKCGNCGYGWSLRNINNKTLTCPYCGHNAEFIKSKIKKQNFPLPENNRKVLWIKQNKKHTIIWQSNVDNIGWANNHEGFNKKVSELDFTFWNYID